MKGKTEMIALENPSTAYPNNSNTQSSSGILSERAAIAICGLGVAVFAIPILVVIQVFSGLYRGGATVYNLVHGSGLDKMDEI
jgi:hypothetical protein